MTRKFSECETEYPVIGYSEFFIYDNQVYLVGPKFPPMKLVGDKFVGLGLEFNPEIGEPKEFKFIAMKPEKI